jgi:hypothetical protein
MQLVHTEVVTRTARADTLAPHCRCSGSSRPGSERAGSSWTIEAPPAGPSPRHDLQPDFAQALADRMLAPEPAAAGRRGGRSHPSPQPSADRRQGRGPRRRRCRRERSAPGRTRTSRHRPAA